jgi:hypothetical protein
MEAPEFVRPYLGKRCVIGPAGASVLGHSPDDLPVWFMQPAELVDHLDVNYSDELLFCLKCRDDDGWSDETLIPIAAVGYGDEASDDAEEFLASAFAYLFWDATSTKIVWATTDTWDRENQVDNLEELAVAVAGER